MARKVTLFTGQWADMPFEELCTLAQKMGYDGLEIAGWGNFDLHRAATEPAYLEQILNTLKKYNLECFALSVHLPGQCVGDIWDPRLDGFAPSEISGRPDQIRAWGIETVKTAAKVASLMGVKIITGFMGSAVWKYFYSFPQTTEEMIEAAFQEQVELWTPIFDEFDKYGVKFALEVHPTEIAFDYYTTQRLLETFKYRETLGLNFDPSHLIWQGVNPTLFLRDFASRVYHVHMKDCAVTLDGRAGILGSHLTFGDTRRGWNFRSLGHGDVNFEEIIRELNNAKYQGPLSVEWEDSGMERVYGATEAAEFVRKIDFAPSDFAFDDAQKMS